MIEAAQSGARIEGILFEPLIESMLAPLAGAMGEFGDLVVEACARSIAATFHDARKP